MLGQMGAVAETFATKLAFMLFLQAGLGRVVHVGQVICQVAAGLEGFGTKVAHKLTPLSDSKII